MEQQYRDEKIKSMTLNTYIDKLRQFRIHKKQLNSRFYDFKQGMNLDLKKYIELAKGERMQKLAQKLLRIYPELNLDFVDQEYQNQLLRNQLLEVPTVGRESVEPFRKRIFDKLRGTYVISTSFAYLISIYLYI